MNKREIRERVVRDLKSNIILDAALSVFAEKGFHETRLEDIAEEAGFSKASLYNYYDNKEVIFLNLVVREHERLIEAVEEKLDPGESLERSLRDFLHTTFTFFGKHFAFILTISNFRMMNLLHFENLCRSYKDLIRNFEESTNRIPELMATLLANARKRGEFDSPLDDATLAKYIGSLVKGVMLEWKIEGRMGNIDEAVDRLMTFIRIGLA